MDHGSTPSPKADATHDASSSAACLLPSDVEACHALIAQLSSSVSELHGSNVQLTQTLERDLYIIRLLLQLKGHRRERHTDDPNQTKLDWATMPGLMLDFKRRLPRPKRSFKNTR